MQVLLYFLGQQAADTALLAAECLVTALITPGPPRCARSFGNPRTGLCLQTASSGFAGSVPLLLLECQGHRREFLLWMPSQKNLVTDKSTRFATLEWDWSLLEREGGQQDPDAGEPWLSSELFL